MTAILLVAGLVFLFLGGELLVRGAVASAKRFGVSPLLIGLTLVGFGTSTPELVTSIQAAMIGSPGIAVGNVVGSNIANILLILGLAALIFPIACSRDALWRDGSAMCIAALVCAAVALTGRLEVWTGAIMVALLAVYIVVSYVLDKRTHGAAAALHESEAASIAVRPMPLIVSLALVVAGLGLTIVGAKMLVDSSVAIAQRFGISDTVIGLTIVAVGTSLPELVASVMAAARRHSDLALGNVLGSNIYNVLGILGVTAIIHPLDVPEAILDFDLWAMLGASALLMVFAFTGRTIKRWEGAVFVALYGAYLVYQAIMA